MLLQNISLLIPANTLELLLKLGLVDMLNSGRKVGSGSKVGPGEVYRGIPRGKTVTAKQELEYSK